jgi:hypothetical protein
LFIIELLIIPKPNEIWPFQMVVDDCIFDLVAIGFKKRSARVQTRRRATVLNFQISCFLKSGFALDSCQNSWNKTAWPETWRGVSHTSGGARVGKVNGPSTPTLGGYCRQVNSISPRTATLGLIARDGKLAIYTKKCERARRHQEACGSMWSSLRLA